ncbi:MAG: T9SS type A sorting domain-containing protein [Flavobacteriales bacterium]|nr:T9SS type A sorting domain-containing protein [Flavobacteriales bacterium]
MKKLFTLLSLTTLIGLNVRGQYDVGCSAVLSPSNNDTIYSNTANIDPQYTRTNYGATVPAATVIMMRFKVDGVQIDSVPRPSSAGDFTAAETRTIGRTINFNANNLTTGVHTFCVSAYTANDNNRSNDETCINFYYSSTPAAFDVGMSTPAITSPAAQNGNEFELGESLETISFFVKNAGAVGIPTGTNIPFVVQVGTGTQSTSYTLTAPLKAGDSLNLTSTRANNAALPNFPTALGDFKIRIAANFPGDVNSGNNLTEKTYKMVASTKPSVASFSPASGVCKDVVTITGTNFSTTPANNKVKFRFVEATVLTATATTLTVEVPETALGANKISVTVKVSGVDKTGESSTNFTYNGCNVGVSEISENVDKVYYSNGMVNISLNNNSDLGSKLVKVINVSGQTVASKTIDLNGSGTQVEQIDLSSSPNGVYVVDIEGYTTTIIK